MNSNGQTSHAQVATLEMVIEENRVLKATLASVQRRQEQRLFSSIQPNMIPEIFELPSERKLEDYALLANVMSSLVKSGTFKIRTGFRPKKVLAELKQTEDPALALGCKIIARVKELFPSHFPAGLKSSIPKWPNAGQRLMDAGFIDPADVDSENHWLFSASEVMYVGHKVDNADALSSMNITENYFENRRFADVFLMGLDRFGLVRWVVDEERSTISLFRISADSYPVFTLREVLSINTAVAHFVVVNTCENACDDVPLGRYILLFTPSRLFRFACSSNAWASLRATCRDLCMLATAPTATDLDDDGGLDLSVINNRDETITVDAFVNRPRADSEFFVEY